MPYVYDTGALVAADRRDLRMWSWHTEAVKHRDLPLTHGGVIGQAWRDGVKQANLARFIRGCRVFGVDAELGREAGELCGRALTTDVIDAAVAIIAARYAAVLLTSDPGDLSKLLGCLGRDGQDVEIITV